MQYEGFAEVYDRLMLNDFDYKAWAAYIDAFFKGHRRDIHTVLDCACGTGLLSIELAKLGYSVTGLDISPEMLDRAGENARNEGVHIAFVNMDMCSFKLHKPVDALISTCDGVNYITESDKLQGFFESAYRSLLPDGLLLFDVSTPYKLKHTLGNKTFTLTDDELCYIWENTYDSKNALSEMDLTLFIKEGNLYKRVNENHIQRAWSIDELKAAANSAGFETLDVYDAFTQEPPHDKSERIQLVVKN